MGGLHGSFSLVVCISTIGKQQTIYLGTLLDKMVTRLITLLS